MPVRIHDRSLSHDRRSLDSGIVLPQNLLTSPGTQYEDFENAADWTPGTGSVAANVTQFKTGTQSLKLTTNVGVQATATKTVNWDLRNFGQMRMWCYIHNPVAEYAGSTLLSLSNDAGFANYFRAWFTNSLMTTFADPNNWKIFNFPQSYFKVGAGAPSWNNPIIRVRITTQAAAGQVVSVSFDDLVFGIKGVPAFMMRFDDGTDYQYNCFARMKPYNIRGSLAMVSDWIGDAGYITAAQLQEMDAAGWSIANHTKNHTSLTTLTEAQQEAEMLDCKNALDALELSKASSHVYYPGGDYDANTFTALANLGMLSGGATLSNDSISTTPYPTNMMGYTDMRRLRSNGAYTTGLTLAGVITMTDQAIIDGHTFQAHWHAVGSGGTQWTTADFQTYIDYLRSKKNLIYPITIDDYYRLTLGPVRVPKVR